MLNISSDAYAQQAGSPPQAPQNPLVSFLPFIIIFFIFYFLVIRPQKKKLEDDKKLLESLKKGDEVYTRSGILGTIHGITDRVITLEVSEGVRIKVLRSEVAGFSQGLFQEKKKEG